MFANKFKLEYDIHEIVKSNYNRIKFVRFRKDKATRKRDNIINKITRASSPWNLAKLVSGNDHGLRERSLNEAEGIQSIEHDCFEVINPPLSKYKF